MTEASSPITGSALRFLADQYFSTIEADVQKEASVWHVSVPEWIEVGFCDGQRFDLYFSEKQTPPDGAETAYTLTPESGFTQSFLEATSTIQPTGTIVLTDETSSGHRRIPDWARPSDDRLTDTSFYEYYDRTAVLSFVRVSVETVSDYETGFLRAVAVDLSSGDVLENLPETVLSLAFQPDGATSRQYHTSSDASAVVDQGSNVASAVTRCQEVAVEQLQAELTEIRSRATQAAHEEFEQYQQLQQQRLQDIQSELETIDSRLNSIGQTIDTAESRQDRMEALQTRKDLRAEKQALTNDQKTILESRSQGFQEQKRDIFERHSIEVKTTPVCSTFVAYERGELELTYDLAVSPSSIRVPYAVGEGVTDSASCPNCRSEYARENSVTLTSDGIVCRECS